MSKPMSRRQCTRPATRILIDGDGPDDYTLSCDEHMEAMQSDTHVGTWPFDGDAPCCHIEAEEISP